MVQVHFTSMEDAGKRIVAMQQQSATELDLSDLDLSRDEASSTLQQHASYLASCKYLDLSSNVISGELDGLLELPELCLVDLSHNLFEAVPAVVSKLRRRGIAVAFVGNPIRESGHVLPSVWPDLATGPGLGGYPHTLSLAAAASSLSL